MNRRRARVRCCRFRAASQRFREGVPGCAAAFDNTQRGTIFEPNRHLLEPPAGIEPETC